MSISFRFIILTNNSFFDFMISFLIYLVLLVTFSKAFSNFDKNFYTLTKIYVRTILISITCLLYKKPAYRPVLKIEPNF